MSRFSWRWWPRRKTNSSERFDGGDVLHIVRALGPTLDWVRLLARFDKNWRVLLGHIVMFGIRVSL